MKEFQGQILNYRFLGTADDQHSFNCRATSVTCTVIQARFSNRRTKGTDILNTVTLRFSGRRPLLPIDFILHKKKWKTENQYECGKMISSNTLQFFVHLQWKLIKYLAIIKYLQSVTLQNVIKLNALCTFIMHFPRCTFLSNRYLK